MHRGELNFVKVSKVFAVIVAAAAGFYCLVFGFTFCFFFEAQKSQGTATFLLVNSHWPSASETDTVNRGIPAFSVYCRPAHWCRNI